MCSQTADSAIITTILKLCQMPFINAWQLWHILFLLSIGALDNGGIKGHKGDMDTGKTIRGKAEFAGCACSGVNLPKLVQPLMLAVLTRGPLHGYAIAQRLADGEGMRLGEPPDHSSVYRLLRGMERRGLLTARLAESESGPARREYALTERGRACLARWSESLSRYRGTIDAVLTLCRE